MTGESGRERILPHTINANTNGHLPKWTQWAEAAGIVRDEEGYLATGPDLGRDDSLPANWTPTASPITSRPTCLAVFAAGDVRHCSIKRLVSAMAKAPWPLPSFIGILLGVSPSFCAGAWEEQRCSGRKEFSAHALNGCS